MEQSSGEGRWVREIVPRAELQYKLKELMFDLAATIEPLELGRKVSRVELLLCELCCSHQLKHLPQHVHPTISDNQLLHPLLFHAHNIFSSSWLNVESGFINIFAPLKCEKLIHRQPLAMVITSQCEKHFENLIFHQSDNDGNSAST